MDYYYRTPNLLQVFTPPESNNRLMYVPLTTHPQSKFQRASRRFQTSNGLAFAAFVVFVSAIAICAFLLHCHKFFKDLKRGWLRRKLASEDDPDAARALSCILEDLLDMETEVQRRANAVLPVAVPNEGAAAQALPTPTYMPALPDEFMSEILGITAASNSLDETPATELDSGSSYEGNTFERDFLAPDTPSSAAHSAEEKTLQELLEGMDWESNLSFEFAQTSAFFDASGGLGDQQMAPAEPSLSLVDLLLEAAQPSMGKTLQEALEDRDLENRPSFDFAQTEASPSAAESAGFRQITLKERGSSFLNLLVDPTQGPSAGFNEPPLVIEAPLPSSAAAPTSSEAEAPVSAAPVVDARDHLYFRLPRLQEIPQGPVFNFDEALKLSTARYLSPYLNTVRSLLVLPEIFGKDADTLMRAAAHLVSYAAQYMTDPLLKKDPSAVVPHLGQRFLLLDALLSVGYLLGPRMSIEHWWPRLGVMIQSSYTHERPSKCSRKCSYNLALCDELITAIHCLKAGTRLTPRATVNLKQKLFCKKDSPNAFRRPQWDSWRQDNKDSKRR